MKSASKKRASVALCLRHRLTIMPCLISCGARYRCRGEGFSWIAHGLEAERGLCAVDALRIGRKLTLSQKKYHEQDGSTAPEDLSHEAQQPTIVNTLSGSPC